MGLPETPFQFPNHKNWDSSVPATYSVDNTKHTCNTKTFDRFTRLVTPKGGIKSESAG